MAENMGPHVSVAFHPDLVLVYSPWDEGDAVGGWVRERA